MPHLHSLRRVRTLHSVRLEAMEPWPANYGWGVLSEAVLCWCHACCAKPVFSILIHGSAVVRRGKTAPALGRQYAYYHRVR